jgi:uncharacterized protein YndB with AHSA1/START domain
MTADLQFDFLVDKEKGTMTIKKAFAARRQLVWDCHTKRELLEQWFAPKPLKARTKSMDFREGGHWHYVMIDPDGTEYWGRADYLTIDPIDGYTLLDGFSDASGALDPDMPRATWDVTFRELPGRTLVQTIISYESPDDLEKVMQMGMQEGMTSALERLDELLMSLEKQGQAG